MSVFNVALAGRNLLAPSWIRTRFDVALFLQLLDNGIGHVALAAWKAIPSFGKWLGARGHWLWLAVVAALIPSVLATFMALASGDWRIAVWTGGSFLTVLELGILAIWLDIQNREWAIDPLTKLPVFTEHILNRLIKQRKSYPRGLCLVLFDVNEFKKCNESHGRENCDELLKIAVLRLAESCPWMDKRLNKESSYDRQQRNAPPDELYRYYNRRGDELLLVLFNASLKESSAQTAVTRILEEYKGKNKLAEPIYLERKVIPALEFTCGSTDIEEGDTCLSIRTRLDDALRWAKKNNKGKAGVYGFGKFRWEGGA